jgi:hypothetical protein
MSRQCRCISDGIACRLSTPSHRRRSGHPRNAYGHGYNVTLVVDAMTELTAGAHRHSVEAIFPKLGETATTDDVLKLLAERPHVTARDRAPAGRSLPPRNNDKDQPEDCYAGAVIKPTGLADHEARRRIGKITRALPDKDKSHDQKKHPDEGQQRLHFFIIRFLSWPDLFRPSTIYATATKKWMPGRTPGVT